MREKYQNLFSSLFSSQLITQEIFRTLGNQDIVIDLGGGTGRFYHIAKFYSNKHTNAFPCL